MKEERVERKRNVINMSGNLPFEVVDSLCSWWWWWCAWCPCECWIVECSVVIGVAVGSFNSFGLIGRNRYDPCAFISFALENTPFRTAVHTNISNNSNAIILNTANIDDTFCLDRVVILFFSVIYRAVYFEYKSRNLSGASRTHTTKFPNKIGSGIWFGGCA